MKLTIEFKEKKRRKGKSVNENDLKFKLIEIYKINEFGRQYR